MKIKKWLKTVNGILEVANRDHIDDEKDNDDPTVKR